MKLWIKPTWHFWAILVFGYLNNGWKGVWGLFRIMVAILLLCLIIAFCTSEWRNFLIKEKGYKADGRFIRFFCKLKMHTWGEVTEDTLKTDMGKYYRESRRLKYGERESVCCHKKQVVSAFLDSKNWFRLDEKYYYMRDKIRQ